MKRVIRTVMVVSILLIIASAIGYISLSSPLIGLNPEGRVVTDSTLEIYCDAFQKNEYSFFMPILFLAGLCEFIGSVCCAGYSDPRAVKFFVVAFSLTFLFFALPIVAGELPKHSKKIHDVSNNKPYAITVTLTKKERTGTSRAFRYYFTLSNGKTYEVPMNEYSKYETGEYIHVIICGDTCVAVINAYRYRLDPETAPVSYQIP
jgi:hypothetical protein